MSVSDFVCVGKRVWLWEREKLGWRRLCQETKKTGEESSYIRFPFSTLTNSSPPRAHVSEKECNGFKSLNFLTLDSEGAAKTDEKIGRTALFLRNTCLCNIVILNSKKGSECKVKPFLFLFIKAKSHQSQNDLYFNWWHKIPLLKEQIILYITLSRNCSS